MTPKAALELVIRMAEAKANGHEHCHRIHAAIAKVREVFAVLNKAPKK